MQPERFSISLEDGAETVIRHYPKEGAARLYISHGNGFAVDGYKVFWEPLLADFELVLFDMRNHGENPPAGADGHHYAQMARDLTSVHARVEQRLGEAKTIGVFHSMSARAAMKNAAELGSPYAGLVLFDPPSVPPRGHALYEAMRGFELKLVSWAVERPDRFDSPDALEAAYGEARASSRWLAQARADMARAVLTGNRDEGYRLACPRELEAAIYLAALTLELWPSADALGVPSMLIGADPEGRGGPPTGPANRALAAEGGYDYSGMEGAGHLMQIEKPAACREALYAFVEKIGV